MREAPSEAQGPQQPPATVSVETIKAMPLEVSDVFPGRVAPLRIAEIRPQVGGIVKRRLFEQGAEVRAGQPLFALNAAPFKAEASMAWAALQRAEAALSRAQVQVARMAPLAQAEAVSQQAYDDAVSQRNQAAADVAQAKATYERRKLDISFATVDAPISGRVDQALQTEGALVSANDAAPMARIVQIDQVYVDLRQPAGSLDLVRRKLATQGGVSRAAAGVPVTVLQGNGEPLAVTGRALFSGMSVDAGTGDVLLRVLVDNPRRVLLPGMFVQARVPLAHYDSALTVPQQAIVRNGGRPAVWTVSSAGQARRVPVTLGELVDRRYRVATGLKAGDRVVLRGAEKLTEGASVMATSADSSSLAATSVEADSPALAPVPTEAATRAR